MVSDIVPWQMIPTPFVGYVESWYRRDNGFASYLHRHARKGWYAVLPVTHKLAGKNIYVAPKTALFNAALDGYLKLKEITK